jgi:hypothetical protein
VTPWARRHRWAARGLLTLAAVLGLVAFARIEHTTPLLLPMVLLVGAVVAIGGMVIDGAGADPPRWEVEVDHAGSSSGQDQGLAGNARLLENHLSARQPDPLLRGRLARLTDDRLARLGLRRDDPGVAVRLGPTLTAVLEGPPRILTVGEIEECIRRIEELSP